jgi:hypothetical protein
VTRIGNGAFNNCTDLTEVTFLGSVPTIGNNAFANTPAAETVFVPACAEIPFHAVARLVEIGIVAVPCDDYCGVCGIFVECLCTDLDYDEDDILVMDGICYLLGVCVDCGEEWRLVADCGICEACTWEDCGDCGECEWCFYNSLSVCDCFDPDYENPLFGEDCEMGFVCINCEEEVWGWKACSDNDTIEWSGEFLYNDDGFCYQLGVCSECGHDDWVGGPFCGDCVGCNWEGCEDCGECDWCLVVGCEEYCECELCEFIRLDINKDGVIDILDLIELCKFLRNEESLADPNAELRLGDIVGIRTILNNNGINTHGKGLCGACDYCDGGEEIIGCCANGDCERCNTSHGTYCECSVCRPVELCRTCSREIAKCVCILKDGVIVVPFRPGDVTGTGTIDVMDALEVLKHLAGIVTLSGDALNAALISGGEIITVLDALEILKRIAGIPSIIYIPCVVCADNPKNCDCIESKKVTFEGSNYAVINSGMTWYDANVYAQSLGGHLVTITSQQEQDFVESLIAGTPNKFYWIGAIDKREKGTWEWVTGEKWEYENWGPGEPNNWVDMWGNVEHYAGIYVRTLKWNDFRYYGGYHSVGDDFIFSGFIVEFSGKEQVIFN